MIVNYINKKYINNLNELKIKALIAKHVEYTEIHLKF